MILRSGGWLVAVAALAVGSVGPVWAQTPAPAAPAPKEEKLTEQKEGEKQKTLWDEFKLFSFFEMGATFNLNGGSKGVPGATSDDWTNTLRLYDINQGYTFNMAEFSIGRDPDEAFPLGGPGADRRRTGRRTTRSASCAMTTMGSRSATPRSSTSRRPTSPGGSRSAMAPCSRRASSSRCSAMK
jgi:hypothetical protein